MRAAVTFGRRAYDFPSMEMAPSTANIAMTQ
jgi:hypothetical protein